MYHDNTLLNQDSTPPSFYSVLDSFFVTQTQKMQLDIDIEPTLRFPYMTSIDKQEDESEGRFPLYMMVFAELEVFKDRPRRSQ